MQNGDTVKGITIEGYIATGMSIVISVGIPLAVFIYLLIKQRSHLRYFLFGIIGFTVSQIILRLPLLAVVQETLWFTSLNLALPIVTFFLIALSAALFEEPARLLFMRPVRNKEVDGKIPLFYGLGHGGIEALLLVGLPFIQLLITQPTILTMQGWAPLLGGLERLIAILVHVSLSYIVYTSIMARKKRYFVLALALHTLIDFSIVIRLFDASALIIELVLLVCAVITAYLAKRVYRRIS